MVTFELFGIVRSKGKIIAIGDGGLFSTDSEKVISKLDQLGFKRLLSIPTIKESELIVKPIKKPKGKKK